MHRTNVQFDGESKRRSPVQTRGSGPTASSRALSARSAPQTDYEARSTKTKSWNPPRITVQLEAAPPLNVGRLRGVRMSGNLAAHAHKTIDTWRRGFDVVATDADAALHVRAWTAR